MSRILVVLILAGAVLAFPSAADAQRGNAVVRDCVDDGVINGDYTTGQYKDALDSIPSEVDEYTDCRAQILGKQTKTAGPRNQAGAGQSGDDSSGSATTPVEDFDDDGDIDDEDKSVAAARDRADRGGPSSGAGVESTDRTADAEVSSLNDDEDEGIPTPLLVLLIALGLGALGGAGFAAHNRVSARRQS